jgi:hypothetical protein
MFFAIHHAQVFAKMRKPAAVICRLGTRRELFDWIHKIYMMRDRPRWSCASGERDLRAFLKARFYLNAKACFFL